MAQDERISAAGAKQIEQNANGRGFACAVQSEESEYLPLDYIEVQIIDGPDVSVLLGESGNRNRRHTCILVLAWRPTIKPWRCCCLVDAQ